ncbi:MAG TPA: iron-sulfur cluster assembly protein, partial [Terriglobales bacterium]
MHSQQVTLSRDCEVVQIPSGITTSLPAGTRARVMQFLGSGYTITTDYGCMYRVDARDADAIGLSTASVESASPVQQEAFQEQMVWDQLKTVYDPEIPVNIFDLGLIYSCVIESLPEGGRKIDVKMS